MSVTITISNNEEYCRQNNLISQRCYDCQRCEFDGHNENCSECGGKGKVCFDELPFEMNTSNSNFSTLWHSLGLDFDYSGAIDARIVLRALTSSDPALLLRETTEETGDKGCRLFSFGIHEEQADRYRTTLQQIATEAMKREEQIVWG
jgi:hypothetical protein